MNLYAKLLLASLIVSTFTSCTSYKTIAKKEEINKDFISNLKTNKKYKFHLTSGLILYVRVDSIDLERVYGELPRSKGAKRSLAKDRFSDTIESLDNNVEKIARKKFNPYLTLITVAAPVGIILLIGEEQTYNITL